MKIQDCEAYQRLLAAVEADEARARGFHDYRGKLEWIVERAEHYAEKTGIPADQILTDWEKRRTYWYMNYYQNCNQPKLDAEDVRVFETTADLVDAIGHDGFRCPRCGGITRSPYECDSGQDMEPGKVCDWKVYGLLRDLGKGAFVFVKEVMAGERIFMPLAWEKEKVPNG